MSLNDIVVGGGGVVLILLTLVQLAPIKVNPWSWAAKKARSAIYGPVEDKLDKLEQKMDEREAANARYRLLRFNDEVLQGQRHTKEHFDQILDDATTYEEFCRTHPEYPNNKAILALENIKCVYRKCVSDHDFL